MADSTKLENKRLYKPMLYQFCIAANAVKTRFRPHSCERRSRNPIKVRQMLSSTLSHIKPSFQQIFYSLNKNQFLFISVKLLLSSIYC